MSKQKKALLFLTAIAAVSLAFPLVAQPPGGRGPGAAKNEPVLPTPRLPNGKVDFGGKGAWAPIWVLDWADKKWVAQPVEVPFTPAGLALFKERRANNSKDDPEGYCLPAGVPRYTGTPYPFQIIQLPDRVVILYEGASHMYRVILMDAKHTADPDPSWLGESIGWREGNDTQEYVCLENNKDLLHLGTTEPK